MPAGGQAGRPPGALPTGNLVAQMFRMPAQAVSAEAKGQFVATAGKVGNAFFPPRQGRGHTRTHGTKSSLASVGNHHAQYFPNTRAHRLQVNEGICQHRKVINETSCLAAMGFLTLKLKFAVLIL